MGMFDLITTTCPNCLRKIEEQIKLDCCMFNYDLDSPISIGQAESLMGIRIACYSCGKIFEVTGDIPTHKVHLYLKEI